MSESKTVGSEDGSLLGESEMTNVGCSVGSRLGILLGE